MHIITNLAHSDRLPAAFEDFLRSFKSASSTDTADALQGLNINGDGVDDEYDLMEDAHDGEQQGANGTRQPRNKIKYMGILQDVADRKVENILIELDDLEQVSRRIHYGWKVMAYNRLV